MGFYSSYKAVFTNIKNKLTYVPEDPGPPVVPATGLSSLKTVILGERFDPGMMPMAIINAEPAPIDQLSMGINLEIHVRGSIVLVLRSYEPADWFDDVISVMGDVADAILADRTLGGKCFDFFLTGFSPGELKFSAVKDKLFYGGVVRFEAVVHYEP